jgi:hypothetical protein
VVYVARELHCVSCGEVFLHMESWEDEPGEEPLGWPGGCPECGGVLVAVDG